MAFDPALYLPELRMELQNPAVPDSNLELYLIKASREVSPTNYSTSDYESQIIDTACHLLLIDGKFPEITSISSGGVSTAFSAQDPERYRRRIAARRSASWMGSC
jgi:hypothetical protein